MNFALRPLAYFFPPTMSSRNRAAVINVIRDGATWRKLSREAWINVQYIPRGSTNEMNFRGDATRRDGEASGKCGFSGRARFRNGAHADL